MGKKAISTAIGQIAEQNVLWFYPVELGLCSSEISRIGCCFDIIELESASATLERAGLSSMIQLKIRPVCI